MQSEDQFQQQCFQWTWNNFPETRRLLWHCPNGGSRNKAEAAKMRAIGVIAGVHDLHMLWCGRFYTFELKVGDNQLTRDYVDSSGKKHFGQKDWGEMIYQHGALWYEIRTFEEFKKVFISIVGHR